MKLNLRKRYDLLVVFMLFLAVFPAERADWFAVVEEQTLSFRHLLRWSFGDRQIDALSKDIVLVNTDEKFFAKYHSFPLRRTDIGRIVHNLKELGAKVIAIDTLMDFPSSYGEDPVLAADLKNAGNTLLVAQADFRNGKFIRINYPTAELDRASASSITNISSSSAIITSLSRLRVYPELTALKSGWPYSVRVAAMFLGVEPSLAGGVLSLGDIHIPLDRQNRFLIDFAPLPTGTKFLSESAGISALEFLDISKLDENDRMELGTWVKDKIVLLGDTSEVSHDWFDTPVGMVYGIEIIADTVNTLLHGAPLRPADDGLQAAVTIATFALLLLLAAFVSSPLLRAPIVLILFAAYVGATTYAYIHAGIVFRVTYLALALLLAYLTIEFRQYMDVRNQKQQISKTFGQYIPHELVDEMTRSGQTVSIGGESREMTVLFSDVRGFTTISEGLAPQVLTQLMNAFLSPMTRVIHGHRGTIDKYMGDAIMAFWGAPLHDPDHARHAVEAALHMITEMEAINADFAARGWKPIKIGVGLNTGVMNVGNMGSDFRLAYTVLGDAVNLGSRLEGLTKQYGIQTIISEDTARAVPDLITRELDQVRVKGKDTPVTIMEPVGFSADVDAAVIDTLARYHAMLTLYRAQEWDRAEAELQALIKEEPGRMLYKIYLDRILHFRDHPPGAAWDGVFTFTTK
ncbi:MAG: adenylate/guanylate cyclase domain-containing protein [Alphaproteobacteria bacterium]|nr:adenylate/guanylate cyclase domain-containing protein [Alphaproteobacteria bacterium]